MKHRFRFVRNGSSRRKLPEPRVPAASAAIRRGQGAPRAVEFSSCQSRRSARVSTAGRPIAGRRAAFRTRWVPLAVLPSRPCARNRASMPARLRLSATNSPPRRRKGPGASRRRSRPSALRLRRCGREARSRPPATTRSPSPASPPIRRKRRWRRPRPGARAQLRGRRRARRRLGTRRGQGGGGRRPEPRAADAPPAGGGSVCAGPAAIDRDPDDGRHRVGSHRRLHPLLGRGHQVLVLVAGAEAGPRAARPAAHRRPAGRI